MAAPLDHSTWIEILKDAHRILDDLEARGFGRPLFSLGGGTVLMLRYKHRLSKDIDLFGYDAQWLSLLTPRLNEFTAALATEYVEQANSVKIVMAKGDIDFVIAGDVTQAPTRASMEIAGRTIEVDPPSEILAKKMYYRASTFKARDAYDMAAAIDLTPELAKEAIRAAEPRRTVLLQRLEVLASLPDDVVLADIIPYGDTHQHRQGIVRKVIEFVEGEG